MTDAPSPILDYASPRPRRRLRLPARSVIDVRVDPDGRGVTIREQLAGIPEAIAGMMFALFVLLVVGAVAYTSLRAEWMKHHDVHPLGAVLAIFWLAELLLLGIVIDRTWRRTTLDARDGRVILRFKGLFGSREHRWPFEEVADLDSVATQEAVGVYALAELRFRATDDVPVHLFTDHRADEIARIQSILSRILAGETPTLTPPDSQTAGSATPVEPPDGTTVSRLVDVRKSLRERETRR